MVPYRYDPEHIAPANNAPRCQRSLAELLLGFLAKPEGDPNAPEPRIRGREDYYAAVGEKRPPGAASPGENAAAG